MPSRSVVAAGPGVLFFLLLLVGCSTGPAIDTPVRSATASATATQAPQVAALPPAPSEDPLCAVATASGAAELMGGSSAFVDNNQSEGDANCESIQMGVGVAYVWAFSPDSRYAKNNGTTPESYIQKQTQLSASVSTLVSSGSDADGSWAEYRASDGSRPMVDVREKDGALLVLSVTPVEGGPGTMSDVRTIAAKIASTLDIPSTLAYSAAAER